MLVEAGADVNEDNKYPFSNLFHAVSRDMVDMVELLLIYGAKDKKVIIENKELSSLMVASLYASVECIRTLINHGMDVNERDEKERNALYYAAMAGKLENAEELINNGITLHSSLASPLPYSSSLQMFHFLLRAGANAHGGFELLEAVRRKRNEIVEELLKLGVNVNERDDNGRSPIFYSFPRILLFDRLIKAGADIKAVDNNNATIMHYYSTHIKCLYTSTIFIQRAVELGVNVNSCDNEMRTPLMVSNPYALDALIENGAKVNERDKEGRTALHHLMMNKVEKKWEGVRILVREGGDVNARDDKGESVLDYARKYCPQMMEELKKMGCSVNEVGMETHKINNGKEDK